MRSDRFSRRCRLIAAWPFVLVQHLDPDYNSALAEIIGERTAMPVVKAADGTIAAPNTVAVIPQNAILKIEGGVLRVAPPETPTARRSSIDTFLVSLAEDQGENAVGIILSGFGSDGTVGIEAIKEGGGLTSAKPHLTIAPSLACHRTRPPAASSTTSSNPRRCRRVCWNIETSNTERRARVSSKTR